MIKKALGLVILATALVSSTAVVAQNVPATSDKNWSLVNVRVANQLSQKIFIVLRSAGVSIPLEVDPNPTMRSIAFVPLMAGRVSYYTNIPPSQDVTCDVIESVSGVHVLNITASRLGKGNSFQCYMQYN